LRDCIHLNNLKVYLRRRIAAEQGITMVDILEYEKTVMMDLGELEDVFGLERTEAGGRHSVEWINGAQGVGSGTKSCLVTRWLVLRFYSGR